MRKKRKYKGYLITLKTFYGGWSYKIDGPESFAQCYWCMGLQWRGYSQALHSAKTTIDNKKFTKTSESNVIKGIEVKSKTTGETYTFKVDKIEDNG